MDPVPNLVLLLLVGVFGYLMLVRPQRAQRQRQQKLVESLQTGDRVLTIGGFYGTVRSVEEGDVTLELGPGSVATVVKAAIARKVVDLDAEVPASGPAAVER